MDLNEFLTQHPYVRLANNTDNERLLKFYESVKVRGGLLTLSYRRRPNFFSLLKAQGDRSFVFYGESKDGDINGIGSVSFRDGVIGSRKARIGYLGDLRVLPTREAITSWRRFLGEFLSMSDQIKETERCSHYITAVLDDNRQASAGLVNNRHGLFRYEAIYRYQIAMIVAKQPTYFFKKMRGPLVKSAVADDIEALISFLDEQNRNRPYGFLFRDGEWNRRLTSWENFNHTNFLLAKNPSGKIIGTLAIWIHPHTKGLIVERMPSVLSGLKTMQNLFSQTPLTDSANAVNLAYATHLEFDRHLPINDQLIVGSALITHAWHQMRANQLGAILSFCDDEKSNFAKILRSIFLIHSTPATLYAVHSRNAPAVGNIQIQADLDSKPCFEMALI